MIIKYIDENKLYEADRKELKDIKNVNNRDAIHVGKYYIHIVYNKYQYASMESYVNTEDSLKDLPISKQPQYIRDFLENLD